MESNLCPSLFDTLGFLNFPKQLEFDTTSQSSIDNKTETENEVEKQTIQSGSGGIKSESSDIRLKSIKKPKRNTKKKHSKKSSKKKHSKKSSKKKHSKKRSPKKLSSR